MVWARKKGQDVSSTTLLRIALVALIAGTTTALAQAPQPGAAPADGSDPGFLNINMEGATLMSVVNSIGAQTGRNFVPHQTLVNNQTPISIVWNHDVPVEYALDILKSILAAHGYVMIETVEGNMIEIRQRQDITGGADASVMPISRSGDPLSERSNELIIHVVQLKYANAQDVATLIQEVGSPAMHTVVYGPTNMITLIDTVNGVRNALELLKDIDIQGYDTVIEVFLLKHARAFDLAMQLEQMLSPQGGQGVSAAAAARQTRVRPATTRASPGGSRAPTIVGQEDVVFIVLPDERLNKLVVQASAPLMGDVRFLVKELDQETPTDQSTLHVVRLQYANVLDVEQALTQMTSQVTPRGGGRVGSSFGGRTSRTASRARTPGSAAGAAQATEVQPFEKNVTITPYEPDSSLLITASPQDFLVLKEVIDKLDVPARQVNVQAIIMEVAITDQFGLTVESALLSDDDVFALNNVATLANFLASGPLALAGPGTTLGFLDGTTTLSDPSTIGGTIEVPNVPLLLRAIETITDLEVLSTPNLLTKNNMPAHFFSGQEIPVPSSSSVSGFTSQSNIERTDAGVTLDVTPQINEGDLVTLTVLVRVSSPIASSVGIDPNLVGATFQKSDISNEVIIKNGQTAVIGGLMRESRDRTVTQTPILGDLPLIGWLFRSKGTGRTKQNLVVLLTPEIILSANELEAVTDRHVEDFYTYKMDPIFEQGFFKKVKRKHQARTKDHPTDKFQEQRSSGARLGPGNGGD